MGLAISLQTREKKPNRNIRHNFFEWLNKKYELNTENMKLKNEIMRWKSKLRKSSRIGVGRFLFCVQGQRIDFSFCGSQMAFVIYRHASHYRALLYIFYKTEVYGSLTLRAIFFPVAFAHFASVSHFGNSHNILTFPLLLYLLWWSGISDHWCYYCDCFGVLWTTSI